MHAALRFGYRYALHAMDARLVFEMTESCPVFDGEDDLFITAGIAFALRHEFDSHALRLGIPHVHTRQIACEDCRFVTARARANLDEDVLFVVGIPWNQQRLQALFELPAPLPQAFAFFFGKLCKLGIAAILKELVVGRDILERFAVGAVGFDGFR